MAQLNLFELLETLDPGGMAKARLLRWDGTQYVVRGGDSVLVNSYAGSHGVAGDRGYCFLGDSERWEVVGLLFSDKQLGM